MNQRESSGLPLRAMVMVLLFLGVVFLLVGFQAMGGDGDNDADSPTGSSTVTSAPDLTCGFSTFLKPKAPRRPPPTG